MRRVVLTSSAVIVLALILGATVFRDKIAQAAQIVSADITSPLDQQGNVKVHEQGIANVSVRNASVPVVQAGTPITIAVGSNEGAYTVPSGKRLVIQYVNATAVSDQVVALAITGVFFHFAGGPAVFPCPPNGFCRAVSEPVVLFANPGDRVEQFDALDDQILISGYLVDA